MFVANFKIQNGSTSEKSKMKNSIWEKEKWTNKGNDKYANAESLLYNINSHTQCLYQISKS